MRKKLDRYRNISMKKILIGPIYINVNVLYNEGTINQSP